MNITKEVIDSLNAVVKIDIKPLDYEGKVETILKDYRRKADVPGFRKGHVPIGMVKSQYGRSIMIDEINKILQESLSNFLTKEKLKFLGNPLPKIDESFSWDSKDFSFEFEIGLAPKFKVDLSEKGKITKYNITVEDSLIDKEVINLQKRFGKIQSKEEVGESTNVTGTFFNEEKGINKKVTFSIDNFEGKSNIKKILGAKKGDFIKWDPKELFSEDNKLMSSLGLTIDDVDNSEFTVEEISEIKLADLNQKLFDKLFGKDAITTVEELKEKIKADLENQFKIQSDQQLLNSVTEYLIENTKFDLPATFLKKWLLTGENPVSEDKVDIEFEKLEKALRYQLIEGEITSANKIQVDFEELRNYAKEFTKGKMAQYGRANLEGTELESLVDKLLKEKDEVKHLREQLISKKLLEFYEENITFKEMEVSYDDFIKEVYK